jgi:hypothetical protein
MPRLNRSVFPVATRVQGGWGVLSPPVSDRIDANSSEFEFLSGSTFQHGTQDLYIVHIIN